MKAVLDVVPVLTELPDVFPFILVPPLIFVLGVGLGIT